MLRVLFLSLLRFLNGCANRLLNNDYSFQPNSRKGVVVSSIRSNDNCIRKWLS